MRWLDVKLLDNYPCVPDPGTQTVGSAGIDLYAAEDVELWTNEVTSVRTGIALAIPDGYVGLVCPRSGLATKGVTIVNAPGVIDPDYRGEVRVLLTLLMSDGSGYPIEKGDRIAQLVIVPLERCSVQIVDSLDMTQRGAGGFGSTGR